MADTTEQGPFERILTLTIDPEKLADAESKAARKLAGEVKIKGFRPGKAPRQVVESVVGSATIRQEAIDDALPELVTAAIADTDLEPAVMPRVSSVRDTGDGVEVDVLVTLWPTVDRLPDYRDRRISVEVPPVQDEDVDRQVDRMRDQFAELDDVKREAFDGDYVMVDVKTSLDDEELAAGSATDMLYEVGSGAFLEGMDEALRGSSAGHIGRFETVLPPGIGDEAGKEVAVSLLVKGVKAKRLPELTDEWVDDVSEFETVVEMREMLAEQMHSISLQSARAEMERTLLNDLTEDLDIELPQALVEAEMDAVLHGFVHRLETQGVDLGQYLQLTGQDEPTFVADLQSQAGLNLKTRLLLEGVAAQEELSVADGEVDEAIDALAAAAGLPADEYRKALDEGGREEALSSDILRRKAIDRLLELAVAVDPDGNEIDLPAPGGETDEQSEGDAGDGAGARSEDEDDGREPAEVDDE